MQRILALDVGLRHTGVAFYDPETEIPLPLETLHHANQEEFCQQIHTLLIQRDVEHLVVGLPLLLDGSEGSQVGIVREWIDTLNLSEDFISFIDERYSNQSAEAGEDHSAAACAILTTFVDRCEQKSLS